MLDVAQALPFRDMGSWYEDPGHDTLEFCLRFVYTKVHGLHFLNRSLTVGTSQSARAFGARVGIAAHCWKKLGDKFVS